MPKRQFVNIFKSPAQHARVELGAPVVVEDRVAGGAGVGRRRGEAAFEVQDGAEGEAEDVQRAEDAAKVVVDDAG
jgi:hypothetical protein